MSLAEPESPALKTPEWLEALENSRRRPHKLAHDVGAGAPCLVCKEGCNGLNLHFWRKICIECKCRKEDHEIKEEEDYPQFEILFGAKKVKRTTLKFNAQNKSFDWIPPNVPPELAVDYLNAIPKSKLPISDSEGARYRKQQLEKQVPLHDVDPNACHNLSDKEMREFEKYLSNLKNNVIGQGRILKYQSAKMLNTNYTGESSQNMLASNEESCNASAQGVEAKARLNVDRVLGGRAVSQSVATESYPSEQLLNVKIFKYSRPITSVGTNLHPLTSSPLEKNDSARPVGLNCNNSNFTSPELLYSPNHPGRDADGKGRFGTYKAGQLHDPEPRSPSSFPDKEHPMDDRQNNNAERDDNCNERSYSEDFRETSSSVLQDPLKKFPQLSVSSDEVPFAPVREVECLSGRKGIGDRGKEESEDEDALNSFPKPPATCRQCLEIIYPEEVVVQTERAGSLALWHASCFVCETCKELLVDLMYFYHKGKVFCGRHYAEMMDIPRCHACDELIFVKEYTCAEGESYHVRHFCCFHCDQPLGGKQYIPKDNFPVCLDCYQVKYGKNCRTCRRPIGAGEQRVSWKDLDFHVDPECFRCGACFKSLLGGKFVVKNSDTFCSKECVRRFLETPVS